MCNTCNDYVRSVYVRRKKTPFDVFENYNGNQKKIVMRKLVVAGKGPRAVTHA